MTRNPKIKLVYNTNSKIVLRLNREDYVSTHSRLHLKSLLRTNTIKHRDKVYELNDFVAEPAMKFNMVWSLSAIFTLITFSLMFIFGASDYYNWCGFVFCVLLLNYFSVHKRDLRLARHFNSSPDYKLINSTRSKDEDPTHSNTE